jgi:hypothetical protein
MPLHLEPLALKEDALPRTFGKVYRILSSPVSAGGLSFTKFYDSNHLWTIKCTGIIGSKLVNTNELAAKLEPQLCSLNPHSGLQYCRKALNCPLWSLYCDCLLYICLVERMI